MKCKTIISLLAVLLSGITFASAQEKQFTRDFGQVTVPEFIASDALGGNNDDAVVIHCLGKYSFPEDPDFLSGLEPFPLFRQDLTIKIKILNEDGLKYATFEFPHESFSYKSNIFDIEEGFTYNMDGGSLQITKLSKADIVDEKKSDGNFVRKIVFPEAKVGSIIELRTSQWFKMTRMPAWYFQREIPVLSSEIVYVTSPYLGYSVMLKGAQKYSYINSSIIKGDQSASYASEPDKMMYVYGMDNLSAYPREKLTNNASDGMVRALFRLENSISPKNLSRREYNYVWSGVSQDITDNKLFTRMLKPEDKEVKNILASLSVAGESDNTAKAKKIFGYVQDNFKWNDAYGLYSSQKLSGVMKKKTGNVADINMTLVTLLRGAGITAYPVALSTRNNGGIDKNLPNENYFNYVVAQVVTDDEVYYLDATDTFTGFGELPVRSSNVEGLLLSGSPEIEWCKILQDDFYADETSANVIMEPTTGVMTVTVERTLSGYAAPYIRRINAEGADEVKKFIGEGLEEANIENIAVADKGKGKPVVVTYSYNVAVEADSDGKISVSPDDIVALQKNFLTGSSPRRLPVNVPYRPWMSYKIKWSIPEGYNVANAFADEKVIQGADSFMSYAAKQENGSVAVASDYYFGKTDYPAGSYVNLQKQYSDMIKMLSVPVVFAPAQ